MRAVVFFEVAKSHFDSFKLFFQEYLKASEQNPEDKEHVKVRRRVFYLERQLSKIWNSIKGGDSYES